MNEIFNVMMRKTLPRPSVKFAREYFKGKEVRCIEIGVDEAENAVSILKNLNVLEFIGIDPYETYNETFRTTERLQRAKAIAEKRLSKYKQAEIILSFSDEFDLPANHFDFIYIDGDHTYDAVRNDILLSWNALVKGGILAGHDIESSDVFKAVSEFSVDNELKVYIKFPDWWVIK